MARILYSRLQMIYSLSVSKTVTQVCLFFAHICELKTMSEKVGFRW